MAEPRRQPLTEQARYYVSRAASSEADHQPQRPRRISLRPCDARGRGAAPAARLSSRRRGCCTFKSRAGWCSLLPRGFGWRCRGAALRGEVFKTMPSQGGWTLYVNNEAGTPAIAPALPRSGCFMGCLPELLRRCSLSLDVRRLDDGPPLVNFRFVKGAVAGLVGIEGGVVSGVFNLESPGVEAPGRRPRREECYQQA
jgi:hypothetical protein